MKRQEIRIDEIVIDKDRRDVHQEKVRTIAASMKRIGLMHPITLTTDRHLVAGGHRVAAAKLLEWETIPYSYLEDDDHAELAEIDENLERHQLDQLQFSLAVNRRKKLWERIHPHTKQHAAGGHGKAAKENPASDKLSLAQTDTTQAFTENTAEVAGVSRRTIERAAEIGEKLDKEAAEALKDTPLADNQKELKALADLPAKEQVKVAKAVKSGKAKKVSDVVKPKKAKGGKTTGWGGDKLVTDAYGKLVRLIDERKEKLNLPKRDPGHEACMDALSTFLAAFTQWQESREAA